MEIPKDRRQETQIRTYSQTEKAMPDYYTSFSFVLNLPDEQAIDYAMNLVAMTEALLSLSDEDRQTGTLDFPKELVDSLDSWSFQTVKETSGIWIHSDDDGLDAACQFVQHLLDRFDIQKPVTFEWANTCSKPCLDAYGGGAVIITPTTIKAFHTSEWVFKQLQRIAKRSNTTLEGNKPSVSSVA